ncbi:MAG: ribonuclease P protein component [Chloroflexi bacterium RBG_13_56_8]|nr:MAG: ribonuclease P protein component [Chloroflexi bacterium RBG_13_56_8]
MPRGYRLTKSADFRRAQSQGQCWSDRTLVLCVHPNGLENSRFGFSVSRRIGKAVARNRNKRLIREVVRMHREMVVPGWDVIFIARRGIVEVDYWAIERSVLNLLRLAGLLRTEHGNGIGIEEKPN